MALLHQRHYCSGHAPNLHWWWCSQLFSQALRRRSEKEPLQSDATGAYHHHLVMDLCVYVWTAVLERINKSRGSGNNHTCIE